MAWSSCFHDYSKTVSEDLGEDWLVQTELPLQLKPLGRYENTPKEYTDFSYVVKIEHFQYNFFIYFCSKLRFWVLPCQLGLNEYPQSVLEQNKKNRYTPAYLSFAILKVGFNGVYMSWPYYPDLYCFVFFW